MEKRTWVLTSEICVCCIYVCDVVVKGLKDCMDGPWYCPYKPWLRFGRCFVGGMILKDSRRIIVPKDYKWLICYPHALNLDIILAACW